ncbi:MAG: GntG family PLP-dependent aldolase [Planctomycetaceae bacterium]|jgi:threonine aldolase
MIDLYSDTSTRPTPGMRQAMASAEVGDDMRGEDPTVNHLEAIVAEKLGKEAAVFACSGTQSNQMGLRVHCRPGDELLINSTGHIANFEGGAPAAISGISVRPISAPHGMLDVENLRDKPSPDDQHFCRTRLVCLENTTNVGGGRVYPLAQMQRVAEWAWSNDLKMHLDGARLFNATVAGRYSPEDVGQCFDTISICFSKGLGCPMGSILVGSKEDIYQARRIRKLFGGALRQAGIVAAAAVYALENHVDRLQEDHENARELALRLSDIDGIHVSPEDVETNLIYFEIAENRGTAVQLNSALSEHGVRLCPFGGQRMRAVTHLEIAAGDIPVVADAVRAVLAAGIKDKEVIAGGPHPK